MASAQHYLNDLVTNGLVEHRLPLNRVREEGRAGTYHILDPFLRVWHRWAAPHRALLETEGGVVVGARRAGSS